METPFFFYYTTKRSILLKNQLVIVTEDGIFNGALVKLQHCRTLPIPAMFGNVKSCLKLLPLPFALPLQLSFRLPPHFKLPVPRAFLYPFNVLSYCLIWLFIPVGSLGILASFFSPFLEILNTWHEFFPLGDFFKHIDVLFGQRRKESINTITLQVVFFLKFLQSFSDFIP